jgi:hypothetical protein
MLGAAMTYMVIHLSLFFLLTCLQICICEQERNFIRSCNWDKYDHIKQQTMQSPKDTAYTCPFVELHSRSQSNATELPVQAISISSFQRERSLISLAYSTRLLRS